VDGWDGRSADESSLSVLAYWDGRLQGRGGLQPDFRNGGVSSATAEICPVVRQP